MKNENNTKLKTAIIYVRVSSLEQVSNFSLGSQEEYCKEFAKNNGYEVLRVFVEKGESAKTEDRTQLQLMLIYCEKNRNKIGHVIFYKVDRFSRHTHDYLHLKYSLSKLGISLISASENFTNTPSGKLHENILASFAQFDNDVRSQRTIEGMKARLLKGLWSSIAPWGYINCVDEIGNKIIKPHPEKAPIVRMLFEKYTTGKYTFKELACQANKLGARSLHGIKFHKQLVAKIIKNPIYYGWINFPKFGISIKGNHEPIISEKQFTEAQSARNKLASRKFPRNKDNPNFPLRGLKCGNCGKNISGGRCEKKVEAIKLKVRQFE